MGLASLAPNTAAGLARAGGRWLLAHPRVALWGGAVAVGGYSFLGGGVEEAEAGVPVRVLKVGGRYGGVAQRRALLESVRAARNAVKASNAESAAARAAWISESKGTVYGFHMMRKQGYELVDRSLTFSGRWGIDNVYRKGTQYALLEAKAARRLKALEPTVQGFRQGSNTYNMSRLVNFLQSPGRTTKQLARELLALVEIEQLESFASLYRGRKLYRLPPGWGEAGSSVRAQLVVKGTWR